MHSLTDAISELLSSSHHGPMNIFGLLLAMLSAYLGGVLSSLTPCVYPMIPITVGVVGGMGSQKRTWREVGLKAAVYVGGMTVIYSLLGVVAGVSGRVFGSMTSNANWYLGLGIIISFAALIMLEVIPFDPAVWWEQIKRRFETRSKNSKGIPRDFVQKEITLVGAFLLGASSGFIAAPCTTPVLTAILAYIAKTQSVGIGFLLMFSFSVGLGSLLVVVAAFAGALQILPRSGQWMKTIKILSGLILLAFGEYLIYRAGCMGGL